MEVESELMQWGERRPQEVLTALFSGRQGLSQGEAERRLSEVGANALFTVKPTSIIKIFKRQLVNPLFYILAVAAGLSLGLAEVFEALLILGILVVNVFLGFIQEYKADRALYELESLLPVFTNVRRGGRVGQIRVDNVVPGDILLLRAGDKIAADAKIISAQVFSTMEATLTGESAPVSKGVKDSLVFAGTVVASGKAEVVVIGTGKQTRFGAIAGLMERAPEHGTPLERELAGLSKKMTLVLAVMALVVLGFGILSGVSWLKMVTVAIALAVAAVPEGLLIALTIVLTAGMRRMLKRQALVRKLIAAETLGGVTVMCLDKTGTLTTGQMAVSEIRAGVRLLNPVDYSSVGAGVLTALSRMQDSDGLRMSATESAVTNFLNEQSVVTADEAGLLAEIPFDSVNKFSAKLWREKSGDKLYVFGAPEVLFLRLDVSDVVLSACHKVLRDMTKRGLRVILVAEKEMTGDADLTVTKVSDLSLVGFVGFMDPLRPAAIETIAQAKKAHIRSVMITGDHPETAAAVARELGLLSHAGELLTGQELTALTELELLDKVRTVNVYARVKPADKVRILQALQANGEVVAMTGDGVNDGPALQAADIGVALGSGTEVAKEAADIVLLNDDIRSLTAAVYEGRVIFDNIRKVTVYLLTFSFSEMIVIVFAIATGLPLPFLPLHILWINLVTDGLPATALAFEGGEEGLMMQRPRGLKERILSAELWQLMLVLGGVTAASLLLAQFLQTSQTFLFLMLGLDSLMAIFVLRHLRSSLTLYGGLGNPILLFSVLFSLFMLGLPVVNSEFRNFFSLPALLWSEGVWLAGLVFGKFIFFELAKSWIYKQPHLPEASFSIKLP